jgi:hypothetical protein
VTDGAGSEVHGLAEPILVFFQRGSPGTLNETYLLRCRAAPHRSRLIYSKISARHKNSALPPGIISGRGFTQLWIKFQCLALLSSREIALKVTYIAVPVGMRQKVCNPRFRSRARPNRLPPRNTMAPPSKPTRVDREACGRRGRCA